MMYYSFKMRKRMDKWRKRGRIAYEEGQPLEASPYYKSTVAAQLWAEGWGNAFADAQPLAAIERLGGEV